jgi:hypothetical protein
MLYQLARHPATLLVIILVILVSRRDCVRVRGQPTQQRLVWEAALCHGMKEEASAA